MASNKPKGTPAQTRCHRYWMAVIGALLAIALGGATGCEAAQKAQDQDTTRKVENGIDTAQDLQKAIENGDVNALKRLAGDKFAERDIALSNNAVCDLSDKTRLTITKAPGWQDGPYKSYVLYSQTANSGGDQGGAEQASSASASGDGGSTASSEDDGVIDAEYVDVEEEKK